MTVSVKHQFTSAKSDGTDTTQVQPSNWNADHAVNMVGPALLGKPTTGTGPAVEITLGANLTFSGTQLVATASGGGSGGSSVGSATPSALGTPTAGISLLAAREDHVHAMPTAAQVGAAASSHVHILADVTGLQAALDAKASTAIATSSSIGLMSSTDKAKLDTVASNATSNSTDAALRDRATHTGTQAISTITNLQTTLDSKATPADVTAAITAVVGAAPAALDTLQEIAAQLATDESAVAALTTTVSTKATTTALNAHIADINNPHATTKAQVGLANVDNTSDVNKPVSTATQTAINTHANNTANPHATTKAQVGLGNVDNTSDVNKPVSTAQAAAIAAITKTSIGLGNVDNTSDVNKPVSTATQTALNLKADTTLATTTNAGLMSAADKFQVNNMPSPQFLWDAVHARTPIIAHAGDSICYMTGFAEGTNYITQALSRLYPSRVEYGDHNYNCYLGNLTGTSNGDGTLTLLYDGTNTTAAFFESVLAVNKWLYFPSSGVGSGWNGQFTRIISFDTTAKTVKVNSNLQYLAVDGAPTSFTLKSGVQLKISEDTNAYCIAKGGHTSTQIKAGQIPIIQSWTVPPDIMMLNGGTNDGTYLTSAQNIIDTAEAALTAGVKIVALMPVSPKDGMASNPTAMAQFISMKNIIATYARNRDGCYLVDASGAFLDPTSTSYQPIGLSTGGITSVMSDGLHPSVRGAEAAAPHIQPLLSKICAYRRPKALSPADVWDSVNNKAGNILGTSGTMVAGTGGTYNGVANKAGTVAGWVYNTYTTATVGGAVQAPVPTITTCDFVAPGYYAQRFDFTGLTSGQYGDILNMTYTRWDPNQFGKRMDGEMVIKINCPNITNANFNISVTGGNAGGDSANICSSSSVALANSAKYNSTDWIFLVLKRPFQTFNQANNQNQQTQFIINIKGPGSVPLSGYIEIAHCGLFALHTS
jgi:hypothetical protein